MNMSTAKTNCMTKEKHDFPPHFSPHTLLFQKISKIEDNPFSSVQSLNILSLINALLEYIFTKTR